MLTHNAAGAQYFLFLNYSTDPQILMLHICKYSHAFCVMSVFFLQDFVNWGPVRELSSWCSTESLWFDELLFSYASRRTLITWILGETTKEEKWIVKISVIKIPLEKVVDHAKPGCMWFSWRCLVSLQSFWWLQSRASQSWLHIGMT